MVMNRRGTLVIGLCLLTGTLMAGAYADSGSSYWPAWRGPNATGVGDNANPPVTWSETQNIKWKVKLTGEGASSPIVWGNKIFFQAAVKTDKKAEHPNPDPYKNARRPFHGGKRPDNIYKFNLVCLDRDAGAGLWERTVRQELPHEGHHPVHGFASYSPITDGEYVWANFGSRGVYCYDLNGEQIWSRDLGKMQTKLMFGEGSSPALADNTLVVVMDHEGDSFIWALNKQTGKTIWKKARDELTTWATPVVVEVNGKKQVITNATALVRSYDFETGDLIWQCGGQTGNAIPSPVAGFGKAFCTTGFRGATLHAIDLGRTGDLTGSEAIISCYQGETGQPNFVSRRLEGMKDIYASPVGAANRVYFVGRKGVTTVIKLGAKFEVLATNTLDDKFDSSPAIAGDELFLKGKTHLYCIAVHVTKTARP
jgi:outer membrane protein assembly factor BamB